MARVLFVQNLLFENAGIMLMSAVLKAHGHECRVAFENVKYSEVKSSLNQFSPDIIGLSVKQIDRTWALKTASKIKELDSNALIIAGGPHPTYDPQFLDNPGIDAINVGEGEFSLLELADAMDHNRDKTRIKNIHIKENGVVHRNDLRERVVLEDVPFADRDIYLEKGYLADGVHGFMASRGCPYQCTFCFNHKLNELYKLKGKACIRIRPVENILREIEAVAGKSNLKLVDFDDSTFCLDKEWSLHFFKEYKRRINIPFSINIRANLIDEEIVRAMAQTGQVSNVRMGLETGNEAYRKKVLKKNISNQKFYHVFDLMEKYNIKICVYSIWGLPEQTVAHGFETIEMYQRMYETLSSASHYPMIFQPYPGLALSDLCLRQGYIMEEDFNKLGAKKFRTMYSVLKQPEIDELINLAKLSLLLIWFPRLAPLVKRIIKIKPNPLFDGFFYISLIHLMTKYYNLSFLKLYKIMKTII